MSKGLLQQNDVPWSQVRSRRNIPWSQVRSRRDIPWYQVRSRGDEQEFSCLHHKGLPPTKYT